MSSNGESLNPQEEILVKAKQLLTTTDYNMLSKYIEIGRHPLSPDTSAKLFELF